MVHFRKPRCVPQLGAKIAIALDPIDRQFQHAANGRHLRHGKTQRIGTKFVDNLKWINHVALGLGHLVTFFVAHQLVQINGVKRVFVDNSLLHHHHSCHPEKQNILSRDQNIGREIFFQRVGLVGPAQRADRP